MGNAQAAGQALPPGSLLWNLTALSFQMALLGMEFRIKEAALAAHTACLSTRFGGSCHGRQQVGPAVSG